MCRQVRALGTVEEVAASIMRCFEAGTRAILVFCRTFGSIATHRAESLYSPQEEQFGGLSVSRGQGKPQEEGF